MAVRCRVVVQLRVPIRRRLRKKHSLPATSLSFTPQPPPRLDSNICNCLLTVTTSYLHVRVLSSNGRLDSGSIKSMFRQYNGLLSDSSPIGDGLWTYSG